MNEQVLAIIYTLVGFGIVSFFLVLFELWLTGKYPKKIERYDYYNTPHITPVESMKNRPKDIEEDEYGANNGPVR